jgi:heme exporter protein CcmD
MSYVVAGYAITLVTLAGYALRVIRRGRALARTLPPEKQWQ